MPHFSIAVDSLKQRGPVCEIMIAPTRSAVSVCIAAGVRPPEPVKVKALIDTGAAITALRQDFCEVLRLTPLRQVRVSTPMESGMQRRTYLASIVFPTGAMEAMVVGASLEGQHVDCLIGRDILDRAVMVYQGHLGQVTLFF